MMRNEFEEAEAVVGVLGHRDVLSVNWHSRSAPPRSQPRMIRKSRRVLRPGVVEGACPSGARACQNRGRCTPRAGSERFKWSAGTYQQRTSLSSMRRGKGGYFVPSIMADVGCARCAAARLPHLAQATSLSLQGVPRAATARYANSRFFHKLCVPSVRTCEAACACARLKSSRRARAIRTLRNFGGGTSHADQRGRCIPKGARRVA